MDKRHIINEIQRLAEANGKPLGKIRFLKETGIKETGIKESDWYGKFWNKWSDAIEEAGLTPNSLQQPLDGDILLQNIVDLIIEIGKYPVKGDLLMKARADSNFPSHNTFQRFGEKPELAQAIISYCKNKKGFDEVIDICVPISKLKKRSKPSEKTETLETSKEDGYVYLIQFGAEHKIGTSNNVERRFRQLKTQMPYEGKIIHTIVTGDPMGIESYWHKYFSAKRLKGEWFKLSTDDIKYFKKRTLM